MTLLAGIIGWIFGGIVVALFMLYMAGRTAQREALPEPRKVKFGYRTAVVTPRGRIGRVGGYSREGKHLLCRVDFADGGDPVFDWYRETQLRAASPTEVNHGHALSWDAEHGFCDSVNCLRTEPHLPHGR